MKSLRMATLRGRPCRADRAANGVSLCEGAAISLRENADRGSDPPMRACVRGCAGALRSLRISFEEVP